MAVTPVYLTEIDNLPHFTETFWAKVHRGDPDDCWLWQRGLTRQGYGNVGVPITGRGSLPMLAHRISWLLTYGDLPLLFMCHKCDERYTVGDTTYRKCVNPAHLFPGTNSDNIQDMYNKGRGRTRSAVGEAHGMTTLTDEQVLELRAAYLSGTRQKELAARYGLWPGTIAHIVQGYTWGHLPNSPLTPSEARRGERNGKAVLTEDDVRSVRVRVAAAESPASIAREYGVKQPAIGKIVARRTWKHVA